LLKSFFKYRSIFTGFLLLILCGGILFVNILYTRNYPGGKYFLTQWTASRALTSSGEDPYSDSVLYKIQQNAYGRPAMAGEYEFRFNYPYFSLVLFLPFGLIKDYSIARAAWMLFLEIMVVLIFLLSINLANWTLNTRIKWLLFIFTMTFYPTLRAIVDGNLIIIVTIVFLGLLISLRDHNDQLAGILLTGLLFEFQYTILLLVVILVFVIIKKRYQLLNYFIGSTILLLGFSMLFQPDWFLKYSQQLSLSLTGYTPSNFIGALASIWGSVGKRIGVVSAIVFCLLIFFEIVNSNRKGLGYFFWLILLTAAALQWSGLPSDTDNFVFLIPGLLYGLKFVKERWDKKGELLIFTICISLFVLTWAVYFATRHMEPAYQEPVIFYVIFPIMEISLLYWGKWWVNRKSEFEMSS
jgi:hypothetical protein